MQSDLRALQDRIWDTWELTYAGAEAFRITEGFQEKTADRRAKELTAEIRVKDDATDFVNRVSRIAGVSGATLVTFNGEYMS